MPQGDDIGRDAEGALLDAASRFRSILENSPDWIWECDLEGNTLYSNPGVVQTLGYSPDELKSFRFETIVHPGDRERLDLILANAIATRSGWRNQRLRWRHRDGDYREVESNASPVFDRNGELVGFCGVDRDVTERSRAEDALRTSEVRFAAAFEASPLAVSIARLEDGRFLAANSRYESLFGWPAADLVGRTSVDAGLWPDPAARKAWVDRLERGRLTDYRTRWRRSDGVLRTVSISGEVIRLEGERCILAYVQDISDLLEAQRQLWENEERFREIAESIPEVFWIVSPDWRRVIYVSPAYRTIWGRAPESLYDDPMDWASSILEDQRPAVVAAIPRAEALANCAMVYFPDYQIRQPEGALRWISARGYPVKDEAGNVLHFAGIAEDITARKNAETELLAAKKAAEAASADKSRFLAAASHDLRQPMQAMTLFASALERTDLGTEQRRMTRGLMRAAASLGGLLDSLLDLSRLDAGVVKPALRKLDLYEIFCRIDNEFSAVALSKGLRFKLCFPTAPIVVETDPELLMAMLRNIVANAIGCTERGGVLVGARRRPGGLVLQVWDSGRGIEAEHLPRIYDEFYQIDNPQRDRTRGLGLGLAIVRRLAALMGYGLECRSRPGRGSVFALSLPVDQAAGPPNPDLAPWPVPGRADPRGLVGRSVVLLEDDGQVAESLALWLQGFGAAVSVFGRADEALADPAAMAADIVVTDFRLPGSMNGLQFLAAVQRIRSRPVRGVVITGDTSGAQADELVAAGWTVLLKPVEAHRLLAAVADPRADA